MFFFKKHKTKVGIDVGYHIAQNLRVAFPKRFCDDMGALGEFVAGNLSDGFLSSLIVDGIIAGVGGVVIFLPQICILFFLLSLLEQSGYISRAAVVTDKIMSLFGLNGKAFLPYMSGFACSIPAIMAARTIANKKPLSLYSTDRHL